jgi:hypothetical protein
MAEAQTHFKNGGTSQYGYIKAKTKHYKLTQENFDKIHRKAEQANKNITDMSLPPVSARRLLLFPTLLRC